MSLPDFGFGNIEQELWRLIFTMVRIGAALIAAPIFGAATVPVQVRIVFAGAIAVFVLNWTPAGAVMPTDLLAIETMIASLTEAVVGFAFGFVLHLSFAAPVLAAEQIAGGMGMAIATAVDPNTGGQSGALGQYFTVVLTLIFLSVGGHLLWLRLLIESYQTFPPGAEWFGADRAMMIVGFAAQMFATAVAIALPVTLVLLLVQMATGVLSRSAPSLNLFSLGLPAGVLAGIAALIAAMPMLTDLFVALALDSVTHVAEIFG
ncbi:flagellar biosynthetic protein FliR [Croceicoccus hydrothermalis]|uniref:flagellar biosynthetic protein FliR n=1 Tax=Croceicoccus hydrothermalis TaxID=2867964 RepID=UPI001EFB6932|nr:flagellar biosynthetic protein FliR [Croceicoccus hydrothermalis]